MSTLVSILLGLVLNVVHGEMLSEEKGAISKIESIDCKYNVQQLNPHYIITRDELLSRTN